MFARISSLTWHHPRRVLAGFGVLVAGSLVFGIGVERHLKPAGFAAPSAESSRAQAALHERLGHDPEPGIVIVAAHDGPVTAAPAAAEVRRLVARLRADREIGSVTSALTGGPPALIARDGRSTAIVANLTTTDDERYEAIAERVRELATSPLLDVEVGGFAAAFSAVNETVQEDLLRAEAIAFPLLGILLLFVFRGVVAALIPLAIGAIAVLGTFLALRVMSLGIDVSVFSLNITSALGLGLAVDYGLLLVSRYREELERHGAGERAHSAMVQTAGRTVVFSGLTVAAAMAALLLFPQRFLYSMGAGGTFVAIFAAVAAVLAVPAILALLGERVNALSLRGRPAAAVTGHGRWYRLARAVMRRPVAVAAASVVVLAVAAAPLLGATFTAIDAEVVPRGQEPRAVTEALSEDFAPNLDAPVGVSARLTPGADAAAQLRALEARIARLDGVAAPGRFARVSDDLAYLVAIPRGDPLAVGAQDLVAELRALDGPLPLAVSGQTAEFVDFKASILDRLPAVLALMAVTTIALLFGLTGSVVLGLKTLVMNALSILAAFGLLVVMFQGGVITGLVGYDGPDAIETAALVVLFAATFGLATDYAVLVLARIKEHHDAGLPNAEAIATGIDRTGRVITAAALALAVVFLCFMTSSVFFMKQVGFTQAVAVIIDATIVRALLVPALMRILGPWNWWAPAPLRRLHQRFGLSEAPLRSRA